MKLFYTLLIALVSITLAYSQPGIPGMMEEEIFPFERVYPSQPDDHYVLDLDTLGNGFITLNAQKNLDKDSIKAMNIISFDKKGNINWTTEFELKKELEFLIKGDVEVLADDSIVFISVIDTTDSERVLTKLDKDGTYGWSKRLSTSGTTNLNNELLATYNGGIVELTDIQVDGASGILYTSFDSSGVIDYSKTIMNSNDLTLIDAMATIDSAVVVLANDSSDGIVLCKIDSLGEIIISQRITSPLENSRSFTATNLTQLANGDYAVSGVENILGVPSNVIIHLNEAFELLTAYIQRGIQSSISIRDIDGTPDSTLIFMGFTTSANSAEQGEPFTGHMRLDSSLVTVWSTYSYLSNTDLFGFGVSNDGGATMYVNGGTIRPEDRITPYLIRYDKDGNRNDLCTPQSLDLQFLFTDVETSSIDLSIDDIMTVSDTFSLIAREYIQFSPPILSLPDTSYCPGDPIEFPMDATVNGGVDYQWQKDMEDYSEEPMIVATEEGMYTAMVNGRNDEMVTCWTLCDTTNITVRDEPMVEIVPDFTRYCESGEVILSAQSSSTIIELNWSNGITGETRIAITEAGTYSVNILDDCGRNASAGFTAIDADFNVNLPLSLDIDDTFCSPGTVRVRLDAFDGDVSMLSWSNGVTGSTSIDVTEPGTYTVMLDGFCTGMAEVEVSGSFFKEDAIIAINTSCGSNEVILTSEETNITSREWFDGSNLMSTSVDAPGNYTINATDGCGDAVMATIDITQDDLDACTEIVSNVCLEYPNAFVPNSQREINREFKPKLSDECMDMTITGYELKIYNRWGNQVFSTDIMDQGWLGRDGSKESPADVYYFYSKYSVNDGASFEEAKGDILLIR